MKVSKPIFSTRPYGTHGILVWAQDLLLTQPCCVCTWYCAGSLRSSDCVKYKSSSHCLQLFHPDLLDSWSALSWWHDCPITWAPPSFVCSFCCMCTSTLFANVSTTVSCDSCLVFWSELSSIMDVESLIILLFHPLFNVRPPNFSS